MWWQQCAANTPPSGTTVQHLTAQKPSIAGQRLKRLSSQL